MYPLTATEFILYLAAAAFCRHGQSADAAWFQVMHAAYNLRRA